MPWIHVTMPPATEDGSQVFTAIAERWSLGCAAKAAELLGLNASGVIVVVSRAEAMSSPGALVTIRGRTRSTTEEAALAALIQDEVAEVTGVPHNNISLVRI